MGIIQKILSPLFQKRTISSRKTKLWSRNLIFCKLQGKSKLRFIQRFSCNSKFKAQNAFQNWKIANLDPSETDKTANFILNPSIFGLAISDPLNIFDLTFRPLKISVIFFKPLKVFFHPLQNPRPGPRI